MSTLADAYETGYRDGLMAAIDEVGRMQPRDAMVTVHHERREFVGTGVTHDGMPNFHVVEEREEVAAKVWPVATSERELLVEWEDGTLDAANLRDIRMKK